MVHAALHEAGGVDYLVRQADENPVAFMSLLGRILPQRIESDAPLVPLSLEEERKQALAEIEEAFASLRKPPPALIETRACSGYCRAATGSCCAHGAAEQAGDGSASEPESRY